MVKRPVKIHKFKLPLILLRQSVGEDGLVETKFYLEIHLDDNTDDAKPMIKRHTNETYRLTISYRFDYTIATSFNTISNQKSPLLNMYSDAERTLRAGIKAASYFGARHGLETLFQLVQYADIGRNFIILSSAEIRDYPEFRHRGISLDTSRNFIEPDVIKRILGKETGRRMQH